MIGARELRRTLLQVGVAAILVQTISAAVRTASFETPNLSTQLARRLVTTHEYAVPVGTTGMARAIQLPGEPLYLAAGFTVVPTAAERFLHVPVAVGWIIAIAAVAFAVGGRRLSLVAGALAVVDPFVIVHGPVWDDTVLAAALEWTILAVAAVRLRADRSALRGTRRWLLLASIVCVSAAAALTRTSSQIVLGCLAAATIAWPRTRHLRSLGVAVLVGIAIGLAAWGVRNERVLGTFFVGSSHDGQTLWHANSPLTRRALVETGVVQTYADLSIAAGDAELAADRKFREEAIHYLVRQPGDAVKTAFVKIFVSLTGFHFTRPFAATSLGVLAWNVCLLVLAGLGWRRANRQVPWIRPLSAAAALTTLLMLLFLALGPAGLRYRMTLAGFVYLGAAIALTPTRWLQAVPADADRV